MTEKTAYVPKVGDRVQVRDEGLEMLRRLCPGWPPNHIGSVTEVYDAGDVLVTFDDTGSAAPYPVADVQPLANAASTTGDVDA